MLATMKILIVWILFRCSVGFEPFEESSNGRDDLTHSSITQAAIYKTAADVISNVIDPGKYSSLDADEVLRKYFGNRLGCFMQTVEEIKDRNMLAQRDYRDEASRTMNCYQVEAGHMILQTLRDNIIHQSQSANPSWNALWDLIGQYLFTLQEFYSNTNWVEMFGDRVCQELGISGKSLPLKLSPEMTLRRVEGYKFHSENQRLTSEKCFAYLGTHVKGKQSSKLNKMDKESSSSELSPRLNLLAAAATQASIEFFMGNDTGLLSIIGIDKFTELLGMNFKAACYIRLTPVLSSPVVNDDQVLMEASLREVPKVLGCTTLTKRRKKRGSGGFDLFDKIANATGGKIVHTSSSSLGDILGSFVKHNMGVTTLQVESFTMTSGRQHKMAVDTDLSLLTVRIEGLSSTSAFSLSRPDGSPQVFSGTASVDVIGSTTVISVQNPPGSEWTLHKLTSGTWNVKVGGSGNIDFTYKFMEDVGGIKYPITGTSPITGTTMILSVTVTGLPPAARVFSIVLKTPEGATLKALPVKDTSSDARRVLYTKFDVPAQEFLVSINGSLNSTIFTREKSDIVTPVAASIQFSSKPEKLVVGKSAVIKVNVTNTGSSDQSFKVTTVSVPIGFVTGASYSEFISAHSSKIVNISIRAPSKTLALLTVELGARGVTLQTIKRTLQVAEVAPPEIKTVRKSDNCAPDMMNYYNCSRQKWTCTIDIVFNGNMSQVYATPHDVNFTYSHNSSAPEIYSTTLSGTCCSYRPLVTAIDVHGNIKTTTVDFSGGVYFNTTVDNFDHLVKPAEEGKASAVSDHGLLYGVIGGGSLALVIIAAILAALIYYNKTRMQTQGKINIDSLSSLCFEARLRHVERNSKPAFVMKA